ncbi:hypothetical protein AK812_SmicGene39415 [Symbiodinium microadriaticum]|uniref:Uncharacterized protein n=1 Tax=Symbiodinium microadriaticum TaxID=2951 RepID=A0A1Q9CB97_SYMMI|nr:hypothetical protein AK812_SmicGene39415 [Symbiodinium microadriaticum]
MNAPYIFRGIPVIPSGSQQLKCVLYCIRIAGLVLSGLCLCTEGEIVEKLEDGGANCVVYAVLAKKTTCNDFCEARNTVCVNAIDNVVSCASKHFFDMQCVCRNLDSARCLQHCSSNADKFLDFVKEPSGPPPAAKPAPASEPSSAAKASSETPEPSQKPDPSEKPAVKRLT